jgi:hypothetical protein
MSAKNEPPARGIESRFHDLSVDVRQERLIRYIIHQVESGRHVNDILDDPYVLEHSDPMARHRLLEHPEVIKSLEEHIRRQFAGYGDSVGSPEANRGDEDSAGRTSDGELPNL